MYILRAGMTGCLAAMVNREARILEPDSEITKHKAVLRFRSPAVSIATGIEFQKVQVHKAILDWQHNEFVHWSPYWANQYSQKVIGGIHDRSIGSLDTVDRWLAPEDFHEQMISSIGDRISWSVDIGKTIRGPNNPPIVSTLPIYELAEILNFDINHDWSTDKSSNIFVTTVEVMDCTVHQTIYVPNLDCPVYRMTLEGQKLIIESTAQITDDETLQCIDAFGIAGSRWVLIDENYEQKIGKIKPLDEDTRKRLLFEITKEHGVYSLGRTAIWKAVLLDDCLQDIHRINKMIETSNYDRMLGK